MKRILVVIVAFGAGFVSTAQGHSRVTRLEVRDTRFVNGSPVSAIYTGYDREGRVLATLKSEMFSSLCLPMQDKENMVIYENFSEFVDLETGEKADGVDEYLISPNEPYHESPGI